MGTEPGVARLRQSRIASTLTVSIRTLLVAVAVCAAVIVAFLLGSGRQDDARAAAAPAATAPAVSADAPTIVMAGSGEATTVPDQLTFAVEVRKTAASVSTALNQSSRTTRAVLEAVAAQGVERDDVQTTGLDIHATYDYSDDGPPVITGYAVSQRMSVLVRSLPDSGDAISAAAGTGGDAIRLHGVKLRIGDEAGLLRKAREAAMADAQAKAQQYAEAAGQSLGEVLSVRESLGGGGRQKIGYERAAMGLAADAYRSVPIRAGSADLDVTVSVVWALEPAPEQ